MKNRDITLFEERFTRTGWRAGAAGGSAAVSDRPANGREVFTVLVDSKTGNRKVTHAHEFIKRSERNYVGMRQHYESGNGGSSYQLINGPIQTFTKADLSTPSMVTVQNTCLSRFYEQLRGDIDLSVDAFQGRQTRDAFREYRNHLIPLSDKLAREAGRVARFVTRFHPSQWGKRWLEYQYGWKPLMQTAFETGRKLLYDAQHHTITVSATASSKDRGKPQVYANLPFVGASEYVVHDIFTRCKMTGLYRVQSPSLTQTLAGYTSLNPAAIAWELMPYSFVVDWIYDIGSYIRNMESAMIYGANIYNGYSVIGYRRVSMGSLYGVKSTVSAGITTTDMVSAQAVFSQSYKSRGGFVVFPKVPVLDVSLGWQRLVSAASLLANHLGSTHSYLPGLHKPEPVSRTNPTWKRKF